MQCDKQCRGRTAGRARCLQQLQQERWRAVGSRRTMVAESVPALSLALSGARTLVRMTSGRRGWIEVSAERAQCRQWRHMQQQCSETSAYRRPCAAAALSASAPQRTSDLTQRRRAPVTSYSGVGAARAEALLKGWTSVVVGLSLLAEKRLFLVCNTYYKQEFVRCQTGGSGEGWGDL